MPDDIDFIPIVSFPEVTEEDRKSMHRYAKDVPVYSAAVLVTSGLYYGFHVANPRLKYDDGKDPGFSFVIDGRMNVPVNSCNQTIYSFETHTGVFDMRVGQTEPAATPISKRRILRTGCLDVIFMKHLVTDVPLVPKSDQTTDSDNTATKPLPEVETKRRSVCTHLENLSPAKEYSQFACEKEITGVLRIRLCTHMSLLHELYSRGFACPKSVFERMSSFHVPPLLSESSSHVKRTKKESIEIIGSSFLTTIANERNGHIDLTNVEDCENERQQQQPKRSRLSELVVPSRFGGAVIAVDD